MSQVSGSSVDMVILLFIALTVTPIVIWLWFMMIVCIKDKIDEWRMKN